MNDTQKASSDTPSTASGADQSATPPNCHSGSCCKPHTSLYISIIALALAGYAAFNVSSNHDNSAMEAQMNTLDSKLSGINQQMETLSQEVQNNRDNLVQNKLKKALENIRDISGIAEEGSKAAISKVESMLQSLTTIGEQLIAPTAIEPTTAESDTASPQPESSSTETAAPENTVSESPVPTEPAQHQPAPNEAAAAHDNTASAPETAPQTTPPADTSAKAAEPATNAESEADTAAPQAF